MNKYDSQYYFLDSNFLIGLINENDSLHEKATKLSGKIDNNKIIISELIINEVVTIIGNRIDVSTAINSFNLLKHNKFHLINEYDIANFDEKTIKNYEKYNSEMKRSKRLSYTDCAIVTIMEELGVKKLISYDKEFERCENIELINNL